MSTLFNVGGSSTSSLIAMVQAGNERRRSEALAKQENAVLAQVLQDADESREALNNKFFEEAQEVSTTIQDAEIRKLYMDSLERRAKRQEAFSDLQIKLLADMR